MSIVRLGSTDEPKALIPGNPTIAFQDAASLRAFSEEVEDVGQGMRTVDAGPWQGVVADRFRENFYAKPKRWLEMADAFSTAASATEEYGHTLSWGQSQAAEAIALWKKGIKATEAAAIANPLLRFQPDLDHIGWTMPTPSYMAGGIAADPGAKLRAEAQALLAEARRQVAAAGDDAAKQIRTARFTALPISGRPDHDPADGRAGKFNSDPWWSKVDDLAKEAAFGTASDFARLLGLDDAANLLRHYLDGTGKDFNVDPDRMMCEVESFQAAVSDATMRQLNDVAQEAAATGQYGTPLPINVDWTVYQPSRSENLNWYLATGDMSYSVTGTATVFPPDQVGGQPVVESDFKVHIWDRYDWDPGESTSFAGFEVKHDELAEMHRAGVAQEFNTVGTSTIHHYSGEIGIPKAP